MANEIDYCKACLIRKICKEDNPNLCELYQNHLKIQKVMKNLSQGERQVIDTSAKSHLEETPRMLEMHRRVEE